MVISPKDSAPLRVAGEQKRIFATRDRDFGDPVFVQGAGNGAIYLRMLPSTMPDVHVEMKKALEIYSETELGKPFVAIEQNRQHIRQIE